jgi:hypothetical protein
LVQTSKWRWLRRSPHNLLLVLFQSSTTVRETLIMLGRGTVTEEFRHEGNGDFEKFSVCGTELKKLTRAGTQIKRTPKRPQSAKIE